ncbi:MAG TPA: [FeFe] hydrogenase H-cluster maturation GTPase HydF [Hungateiclostridium thermocellum]|jgi:[FeFe] hydrogenase H-cluster maturation GTPase HydF|uniref:Small GTP-binding protein n=2 Tax=Acetivibrio thermocellus TaxID=1515 RepID=A3DBF4_ACET2|nr:[FeFe] hydrogenase H-cluster maturation GTPase HydF [Acetivibrio thermocellus]CDG34725.1 small GTP-binding protein [Acetivibrio thermocellus BC1]ABN51283.1 small GTP-binding protein [Acetivibrio thermocellus ATCC 27405]ADU75230.1 small GTP-binding protein [Acetivibrio thermocellus DSM 1313]ALX09205.1 (FeFe)-hydrogenase H-cluster maturation GTPase HydF [Acetivibrio thermocellus AD2]ANV76957.1 (FeFe)-hydrogenase H-cluster maturation GTPase HydF [Acetivibrio thermocellus DSM 2360]
MGLNETPSANRLHIGFFGKRNAGKSSVVNAVTGQNLAIVSDVKGTTTDPVYKAMELLPLGPVVIIDTPGIDDEGTLGEMRVKRSRQVLNKTDIAVLVIDATCGKSEDDEKLIELFEKKDIKYVVVYNKADLEGHEETVGDNEIYVSAKTGYNINKLKEKIASLAVTDDITHKIVGDLISPSDFVVLVVPIDKAAPKGRLILPQQQTIRDILESDAVAIVVKENELKNTLDSLGKKPKLVITDSQAFEKVAADTPDDIYLTSFSILFARYKGNLEIAVKGAKTLDSLQDGDTVLISEGCTHHRQCDDIGTVKLPRWINNYTKKNLNFEFTSGTEFPEDLTRYKLIVHCGGCMLNEREMKYRYKCAVEQNVPITNYGILIAYVHGILKRSLQIFPDILAEIL